MSDIKRSGKAGIRPISVLYTLAPYLSDHKRDIAVVILMIVISITVSLSIGLGIRYTIDGLPDDPEQAFNFLNRVLIIALAMIVALGVVAYLQQYYLQKIAAKMVANLRCGVFDNVLRQNLTYFDEEKSGDIQTRVIADTSAVGNFISSQIPMNIAATFTFISGLAGAFYISTKLTLMVLIVIPFLFLPFWFAAKPLRKLSKMAQTATADVGRFAGESLRSIKVILSYNKQEEVKDRFLSFTTNVANVLLRRARLRIFVSVIISSMAMAGTAVLIWSCAKSIYSGQMTMGDLVSFGYFVALIVRSVGVIVNLVSSINIAIGTAEKITAYLNLDAEASTAQATLSEIGQIQFRNVHFCYPNRPAAEVLKGIELTINPGEQLAVVGPSGAGKSTLFELLLGFYQIDRGSILINGVKVNELNIHSLRSTIGFVPQKENLVSGTVFDNIAYGIDNASEVDVIHAAKAANADTFIRQLPDGYHTNIGEAGDKLSGGQKQQISLARALIRNPRILLLDEVTSALDTKNSRTLSRTIRAWAADKKAIVITIAHRLSTIQRADLIVVLDKGRIVGRGRHSELLENCSIYKALCFSGSEDDVAEHLEAAGTLVVNES